MDPTLRRPTPVSAALLAACALALGACDEEPADPPPAPDDGSQSPPPPPPPKHEVLVTVERLREVAFREDLTPPAWTAAEAVYVSGRVSRFNHDDALPNPPAWPTADTCVEADAEADDPSESAGAGLVTLAVDGESPIALTFSSGTYQQPGDSLPSGTFAGGELLEIEGEGSDPVGSFSASVNAPPVFADFTIDDAAPPTTAPGTVDKARFRVKWGGGGSGAVYLTLTGPRADGTGDVTFRCTATDDEDGFQVPQEVVEQFKVVSEGGYTGHYLQLSVWRQAEASFTGTNIARGTLRVVVRHAYTYFAAD